MLTTNFLSNNFFDRVSLSSYDYSCYLSENSGTFFVVSTISSLQEKAIFGIEGTPSTTVGVTSEKANRCLSVGEVDVTFLHVLSPVPRNEILTILLARGEYNLSTYEDY